MNLELKEIDVSFIDEYVELFLNVFSKPPWNDQWQSPSAAKSYLMDIVNTPGFRGYVASINNQMVGVIIGHIVKWWQGDEFYLREFFVDPRKQKSGIGTQLTDYMEKSLVNEQVKTIILLTEQHTSAYEFYTKLNYTKSEDTIFMVKNIK